MEELTVRELTVRFDGRAALDRFSLRVPAGSLTCVMGRSGSGKTTLLRVMMGLLPPDEGVLTGFSQKRLGVVFQENRLCENLSVRANLRLVCPGTDDGRLAALLSSLGLEGCLRQPVRLLSGGMQRRVALARALLAPYELLLLDEPFSGLDDATLGRAVEVLRAESAGKSVFLVTHSEEVARALANQIVVLP